MRRTVSQREKAQIKEEADYTCQHCGYEDESGDELVVDHIVPYSLCGVSNDLDSQCLCWDCNKEKGNSMPDMLDMVQPQDMIGEPSLRINLADRVMFGGLIESEGFEGLPRFNLW